MKHTQGKWRVHYYHDYGVKHSELITPYVICNQEKVATIAIYDAAKGDQKTADANAQLIAAAPETKQQRDDLLDALKELAATFVGLPEGSIGGQAMKKANEAIAKAENQ